jgi:hypothetical protein
MAPAVKLRLAGAGVMERQDRDQAHYSGYLQQYAAGANRGRVVMLLCKGRCGRIRWALMNQDYPGESVLLRAKLGDFSATCLKCCRVAKDAYNWYR